MTRHVKKDSLIAAFEDEEAMAALEERVLDPLIREAVAAVVAKKDEESPP